MILELVGYKVEELVDRDMLEVATRAVAVGQEPLEDLLVGILLPLIVGLLAALDPLFVEIH
jgi:hypothetical protein